ncbi:hypothetical protein [Polaribacter sp. ALD11]|nr:hypothetical protein [Polaribacter sp. ALD11]
MIDTPVVQPTSSEIFAFNVMYVNSKSPLFKYNLFYSWLEVK